MNDPLSRIDEVLSTLSGQGERRCLTVLEASIWDVEAQLARVGKARAEPMKGPQTDIHAGSMIR